MVAAAASQLGLFTPTPPGCGAAMTHGVLESELVTLQGGPKKTKPHTFVHIFAKY